MEEAAPIDLSVDSPWGKYETKTWLGFIFQLAKQLQFFLKHSRGHDTDHTRRDIKGYRMILEKGDEELAAAFIRVKAEARELGRPYRDNIEVAKLVLEGKYEKRKA